MTQLILPKDKYGCPYLQLAPMEGVGERSFRRAIAGIGGFDEAVRDFLRVPRNAHVKSLAKKYDADELGLIPIAAQIMGSDPELMAAMARELVLQRAPHIDINCGCPSSIVTGRGAGSRLLMEPKRLFEVARAVTRAVSVPVTVKMRSGYLDTTLFFENLAAAQESGVQYITLHPRTKVDGYGPPANWDLIRQAKQFLQIPVVGNGDICSVADAICMLETTGCDGLMIGRGSVMNPFIFLQIRAHFSKNFVPMRWEDLSRFFRSYISEMPDHLSGRLRVNKLKQLVMHFCKINPFLMQKRIAIFTASHTDPEAFFAFFQSHLQESWQYYLDFVSSSCQRR